MARIRFSLEARLAVVVATAVGIACGAGIWLERLTGTPALAWLLAFALALPVGLALLHLTVAPVTAMLTALGDSVRRLREGDFSLSLAPPHADELGELARLYNDLGDILRRERQNLYQREMLLDTVIQATPLALVLTDDSGRVVYSNTAGRKLFAAGRKMEGQSWQEALESAPTDLREALRSGKDGVIASREDGATELYQVAHSPFTLNARAHVLHVLHRLTRELTRQELATWKKVIRVMSHEINNSLAPISSLAHSVRQLTARDGNPAIDGALETIQERALHLTRFLEGYAQFAKLPMPRLELVTWAPFVEHVRGAVGFRLEGDLPRVDGCFDAGQMSQALINLLKNAHESGSPADAVALRVSADGQGTLFRIVDRGPGMAEEVLRNALLPFYSTKATGTGLGLALCRDIAEAHGGRLSLANRDGGGLEVRLWLPQQSAVP